MVHRYLLLLHHLPLRPLSNIVTFLTIDRFSPMDRPTPALIMSILNDPRRKSVLFKQNLPMMLRYRPSTWPNKHQCHPLQRSPCDRQPIKIRACHTISAVLRHPRSVRESVVCRNDYSRTFETRYDWTRQISGGPRYSLTFQDVCLCAIPRLLHLVAIYYFLVSMCMCHCTCLLLFELETVCFPLISKHFSFLFSFKYTNDSIDRGWWGVLISNANRFDSIRMRCIEYD